MIHYILGRSGSGKTQQAFETFESYKKALFLGFLRDDVDFEFFDNLNLSNLDSELKMKSVINLIDLYRDNLNSLDSFISRVFILIAKAISIGLDAIFLDEFQLYCSDEIVDLILKNKDKIDFYIIHQFKEQIDEKFFQKLQAMNL